MLQFDPTSHTYTKEGVKYTSVTTFLKKFHKPFEAEKIAKNLIETNPKYSRYTLNTLLEEWQESANLGTQIHAKLESYFYTTPEKMTRLYKAWKSFKIFDKKYNNLSYEPEKKLWSDKYKLAGTADVVVFNHIKKIFFVCDFKTNKTIWEKSFDGTKMYDPVSELDDCNYNHYKLQLGVYTYMIEEMTGYKPFCSLLLHFDVSNLYKLNESIKTKTYNILYEKTLIQKILNYS